MTSTYSTTNTTYNRGLSPSSLSIVLWSTELTLLKPVRAKKRQWPSGVIHLHSLAFYKKPCRSTWKTILPQRKRSKNLSDCKHRWVRVMSSLCNLMWTNLRTILMSSVCSRKISIRKFSLQQKLPSTSTATIHWVLQCIRKTRWRLCQSCLVASNCQIRRRRCRGQRTHFSWWSETWVASTALSSAL